MSGKLIGIVASKIGGVEPWDPDSIQSGITGSEEAVIYVSQELAHLGDQVIVFGDPPAASRYRNPSANPRFIDSHFYTQFHLDVAISWRMPEIAEILKRNAQRVYFWPHDVCVGKLTTNQIEKFDDVLWLSEWQREHWISINPSFSSFTNVFGNGINIQQFHEIRERENPFSCIYGSNYARGLEVLLEIWPDIKSLFPKASLEIYYGWQHFGLLSSEKEAKMRDQIHQLSSLDVIEKGRVGHRELNKAYSKASFWTYPCVHAETFCISALRAQYAGAVPVIIKGAALSETVRHGYPCLHPSQYFHTLVSAMQDAEKISVEERKSMREFILREYTWKTIAQRWEEIFSIHSSIN